MGVDSLPLDQNMENARSPNFVLSRGLTTRRICRARMKWTWWCICRLHHVGQIRMAGLAATVVHVVHHQAQLVLDSLLEWTGSQWARADEPCGGFLGSLKWLECRLGKTWVSQEKIEFYMPLSIGRYRMNLAAFWQLAHFKLTTFSIYNKNLAIASRLRVSCAHIRWSHWPKYCSMTLKSRLRVTRGHWKRNH